MADEQFTGIRLPENIKPSHYDLTIKPDFKTFTFEGTVKIDYEADVSTPINKFILHALEMEITKGYVGATAQDTSCPMSKVVYSEKSETATILFGTDIPAKGCLTLEYKGILNDKMHGFYRTSFKLDDVTVFAGTTQFESTQARRAFPCWDEPSIKATFTVTLIYDKFASVQGDPKSVKYPNVALSNMPMIEQNGDNDLITAKFDKSVKMSTYLLAFVIGPFECVEGSDGKRQHRVYTTLGKKEQGRFALDVSIKSLKFYEEYFNIDYPLKKLDLIAIPDFSSGAMENWGLVTYRESCLLVDLANKTTLGKEWVALVIAHELAHQWFGNLVTMEWWTHLWLNEGFANFMEYLCVSRIIPEWDIWSHYASDTYAPAMELDALHNSHPIEVPVNHPSEIEEIFDTISYNKGSSVIRMLYQYIGDDAFRRGMHDYLSKFAYKNAVTEDLWACLEQASNKPIGKLMSGWTSQKGFPWLSVKYLREGGDSVKLSITQCKFTADGTLPAEDANSQWIIPLDAVTGLNPSKTVSLGLLEGKDNTVTVDSVGDSWVKLNSSSVGLYRTAYPEEMLQKLLPAVSTLSLQPVDRFGLQNDFFALCQAGKVKTTQLLKLLEAYKNETNYTVWSSIDSCFGHLSLLLSNTDYKEKLHAFGRNIYANIFEKLTWNPQPNESYTDPMLRALIINRLVSFGDEKVIKEAIRKYKAYFDQKETIPADLRAACFRAVSSHGDDETFDSLFKLQATTKVDDDRLSLERAIGSTKVTARLPRVYEFVFSDAVKNQDKALVLVSSALSNPQAGWKLFKERADLLKEIYASGHLLSRVVKYVTENLATEEYAQEVSKFFEQSTGFAGCERTVKQSLEQIRLNANWLSRDGDDIKAFLP